MITIAYDARGIAETCLPFGYIAELGAAFLCADLSITQSPRPDHAQYLASWLEVLKTDKKSIFTAASKASQAVAFLRSESGG